MSIGEITKLYWKEAKTNISFAGNACFTATRGNSYTVPAASAQIAATGDSSVKVTEEVRDSKGNTVALNNRKFTVTDNAYTITSVSYTHLDVYKRQVLCMSFLSVFIFADRCGRCIFL